MPPNPKLKQHRSAHAKTKQQHKLYRPLSYESHLVSVNYLTTLVSSTLRIKNEYL